MNQGRVHYRRQVVHRQPGEEEMTQRKVNRQKKGKKWGGASWPEGTWYLAKYRGKVHSLQDSKNERTIFWN